MSHAWTYLLTASVTLLVGACSGSSAVFTEEAETTNTGGATGSSSDGGSSSESSTGGDGAGGGGTAGNGSGASEGCGNQEAPVGVTSQPIEANSKPRSYVLSVPTSYDPNTPIPVVFAWHGLGGSGTLARLYFGVEEQAAGQAIFVYPNGLVVRPQGATGWDLDSTGDDIQLFDAILSELEQSYCVDTARLFSTGHSFGGYLSNALGCARADVLRAIAPVASGGPFSFSCSGPLAAWITHGSSDAIVEFSQGEGSRDRWLNQNSCGDSFSAVTPTPCVAYDNCEAGAAVHWCPHTGGHDWPDFAASGIWDFFASMSN